MTEQTVPCRICGQPYVFYAFYAADQSACPSCRARARGREEIVTVANTTGSEDPIDRLIRECGGR